MIGIRYEIIYSCNQNPFNMNIRENLKLVNSKVTDKRIKEVCEVVALDEFIESLPDKYDTLVGEGSHKELINNNSLYQNLYNKEAI